MLFLGLCAGVGRVKMERHDRMGEGGLCGVDMTGIDEMVH